MADDRQRMRQLHATAAGKYRPDRIDLLLVAEAPPSKEDRYFYFEDVHSHDWLFVGVAEVLLGKKPDRKTKANVLEDLKGRGVFLVDLKLEPIDGSPLSDCVRDLVERCKALAPRRIVLIKATVYDVAYRALRSAGLPVVDKRIPFPSTGRQKEFKREFSEALVEHPEMKERYSFTRQEAEFIRHTLDEVRGAAEPAQQKLLRDKLRRTGFYISHFTHKKSGFTRMDFDELVKAGAIKIL